MKLLKKLSPATIMGANIKKMVMDKITEDGGLLDAFTVFGVVSGFKNGEHASYGPWTAFAGTFEAINLITGEVFRGAIVFLPDPLEGMMLEALSENEEVSFSCTVSLKRRDDLVVNYEYIVTPHVETVETDPLAHLRKVTAEKTGLALPSPHASEDAMQETATQADIEDAVQETVAKKGKRK